MIDIALMSLGYLVVAIAIARLVGRRLQHQRERWTRPSRASWER